MSGSINAVQFSRWGLPPDLHFRRHIASGAYGDVVEVYRKTDNRQLAIKRLRNVFGSDPRRFASALREVAILRQLESSCVAQLHEVFVFPPFSCRTPTMPARSYTRLLPDLSGTPSCSTCASSVRDDSPELPTAPCTSFLSVPDEEVENMSPSSKDVYLLLSYYPADLARLCRTPKNLTMDQARLLFTRVLIALLYMKRYGVIHRDVKPSNILVDTNCNVRISDFGQATVVDPKLQETPTFSVTTRWYRAPEAIAGVYVTPAADAWAAGCVLAELLEAVLYPLQYREPLFPGTCCAPWSPQPGASQQPEEADDNSGQDDWSDDEDTNFSCIAATDLRSLIAQRVGVPPLRLEAVAHASPKGLRCMQAVTSVFRYQGAVCGGSDWLEARFASASKDAVHLLRRLLDLVPQNRITVEQALEHPWITQGNNNEEIAAAMRHTGQLKPVEFDLSLVSDIERGSDIEGSKEYYYNLILDQARLLSHYTTP